MTIEELERLTESEENEQLELFDKISDLRKKRDDTINIITPLLDKNNECKEALKESMDKFNSLDPIEDVEERKTIYTRMLDLKHTINKNVETIESYEPVEEIESRLFDLANGKANKEEKENNESINNNLIINKEKSSIARTTKGAIAGIKNAFTKLNNNKKEKDDNEVINIRRDQKEALYEARKLLEEEKNKDTEVVVNSGVPHFGF